MHATTLYRCAIIKCINETCSRISVISVSVCPELHALVPNSWRRCAEVGPRAPPPPPMLHL